MQTGLAHRRPSPQTDLGLVGLCQLEGAGGGQDMWRKPRGQSRRPVSGSGQSKVATTGAREGGVRGVRKPGVRRGGLSEEVTGGGRAREGAQKAGWKCSLDLASAS